MEAHLSLLDPDRLQALKRSNLLDTPSEVVFDKLTYQICHRLNVPISVISLIEPDRQFFKSQQGMGNGVYESHIRYSMCRYVVEIGSTIVIKDASIAVGVRHTAAVKEDNLMAYLGAPFIFEGHILGSVCAADKQPRNWSDKEIKYIEEMASQAQSLLTKRNILLAGS